MATTKEINVKGYCDTLYSELSDIKKRIDVMMDNLEKAYGFEGETFDTHSRHLCEIADFVDWKLQILMKACPYDWKGMGEDVETRVSVREPEDVKENEFSGGYVGG